MSRRRPCRVGTRPRSTGSSRWLSSVSSSAIGRASERSRLFHCITTGIAPCGPAATLEPLANSREGFEIGGPRMRRRIGDEDDPIGLRQRRRPTSPTLDTSPCIVSSFTRTARSAESPERTCRNLQDAIRFSPTCRGVSAALRSREAAPRSARGRSSSQRPGAVVRRPSRPTTPPRVSSIASEGRLAPTRAVPQASPPVPRASPRAPPPASRWRRRRVPVDGDVARNQGMASNTLDVRGHASGWLLDREPIHELALGRPGTCPAVAPGLAVERCWSSGCWRADRA